MGSENGWRPRLVACDVDGTLVDHDGRLPTAVGEAIALVLAAGVPVVLATGRSWHGTLPLVEEMKLPPGPSVCSNGTLIAVEEIGRGYRLNNHFPGGDLTGEMIIEDVEQLSARPVTRIILRDPTRSDKDFVGLARHLGLDGVTYFVGWSAWLDIAPAGVNKATALAEVAAGLGIPAADVLAFGDGRNDIEMLRWAGRGVAIGDAPLEVQAAADDVSVPFADGGPVFELRRWFS